MVKNWISKNKKWFFSGAGVALISAAITILLSLSRGNRVSDQPKIPPQISPIPLTSTTNQSNQDGLNQSAGDSSNNFQFPDVDGDITINIPPTPIPSPSTEQSSAPIPNTRNIRRPDWKVDGFNHTIHPDNSNSFTYEYTLISGADFDEDQKSVSVVVDLELSCESDPCFLDFVVSIPSGPGFYAHFKDQDENIIAAEKFKSDSEGSFKRYTVNIPDRAWSRWLDVVEVAVVYQK